MAEGRQQKAERQTDGLRKGQEFRGRTKQFALAVIRLFERVPAQTGIKVIQFQLLKSSSSIAANYREACRSRTHDEFVSKIQICLQEADETQLWLELLEEGYGIEGEDMGHLLRECDEIISILVAMTRKAKR
jgi:four helix bundle protein